MKNEKMNNIILNNQINSNIHEDFFKRNGACFLLCVANQIEEKVISVLGSKYKVLHIGSIEKEEICFKIMILQIYSLDNRSIVTLKINKQNYSLDLNPGINFTFDQIAIEQTNKSKVKLNCFDMYEEFYIYSRLISNYHIKSLLINKALDLFETNEKNYSFSFFINILIYSLEKKIKININKIEIILLNIKEKGDLTKIYKNDLAPYMKVNKKRPIYDAFIILNIYKKNEKFFDQTKKELVKQQKIKEKNKFEFDDEENSSSSSSEEKNSSSSSLEEINSSPSSEDENEENKKKKKKKKRNGGLSNKNEKNCKQAKNIFKILNNYPNLFLHSLQLFPDFSFLIKKIESINDLKIILKCSIGLFDMISIINENKEYIIGNIIKNKSLNFYEFIEEKTFSEPLDQNIYSVLNNIKEYEKKNNNKILGSNMNDRLNMIRNVKDIKIQIRIILFEFLNENFIEKEIIYNILSKKKKIE